MYTVYNCTSTNAAGPIVAMRCSCEVSSLTHLLRLQLGRRGKHRPFVQCRAGFIYRWLQVKRYRMLFSQLSGRLGLEKSITITAAPFGRRLPDLKVIALVVDEAFTTCFSMLSPQQPITPHRHEET